MFSTSHLKASPLLRLCFFRADPSLRCAGTVAAAEAAIGLAILVIYFRNKGSIAVEDITEMKG